MTFTYFKRGTPIDAADSADVSHTIALVPQSLKDGIAYAHENIARFAQPQRDSFT
jgi:hypothetical protein